MICESVNKNLIPVSNEPVYPSYCPALYERQESYLWKDEV